jgi:hypothetical protein
LNLNVEERELTQANEDLSKYNKLADSQKQVVQRDVHYYEDSDFNEPPNYYRGWYVEPTQLQRAGHHQKPATLERDSQIHQPKQ